jgi:glycosyltransferase involved in cell wall biosynthesis
MTNSYHNPDINNVSNPNMLYISLNPNLLGPLPKIDPLLIKGLEDLGCHVTKGSWGHHTEDENVFQKILGRFGDIIKVITKLTRQHYDILYVATTLDKKALLRDVLLLLAVHWFSVKKVLIEHGSNTAPLALPGNVIYKFLTRLLIRLSDAILLLSNEEIKSWIDFEPNGKYYRVDNPFSSSNMPTTQPLVINEEKIKSRPTLLFVGRLIQAKGIFDLLDAMPIILGQVDCDLLIVGAGEENKNIKDYIERTNLGHSVSLLGYLDSDHLADVYMSSSVFILPTYFGEGFPTVITEAMSFGLPIVTTALRGVRDHLQDGLNALFVQPRDPPGIANAVIQLLRNPGLHFDMHQANLAKVQDFRPERVAPKYVEIFSELLQSRR